MGWEGFCCSAPFCAGESGGLIRVAGGAAAAKSQVSTSSGGQHAVRSIVAFAAHLRSERGRSKALLPGEILLQGLDSHEEALVDRATFQRHLADLGFQGDGAGVFDALDEAGHGVLSIRDLRDLIDTVAGTEPISPGKGPAKSPGRGKDRSARIQSQRSVGSLPNSGKFKPQHGHVHHRGGRLPQKYDYNNEQDRHQGTRSISKKASRASPRTKSPEQSPGRRAHGSDSHAGTSRRRSKQQPEHHFLPEQQQHHQHPTQQQEQDQQKGLSGAVDATENLVIAGGDLPNTPFDRGVTASTEAKQETPRAAEFASMWHEKCAASVSPPASSYPSPRALRDGAVAPAGRIFSKAAGRPIVYCRLADPPPLGIQAPQIVLRPLPYDWGGADDRDNRPREFVFKGQMFKVPLLPLHRIDPELADTAHTRSSAYWTKLRSHVTGGGFRTRGDGLQSEPLQPVFSTAAAAAVPDSTHANTTSTASGSVGAIGSGSLAPPAPFGAPPEVPATVAPTSSDAGRRPSKSKAHGYSSPGRQVSKTSATKRK